VVLNRDVLSRYNVLLLLTFATFAAIIENQH